MRIKYLALALLTGLASVKAAAQSPPPRKDIPTIVKAANGAIVTIIMANGDQPIARGTGFLVSTDGLIVTNYHVIANGNVGIVKFSDGTILPVDGISAADKSRDLAVIKIHGRNCRTLTLGNSDRVQIGEDVVAIGNPLGLELTVSNGILSGVRTVETEGGKFLQITAPISHGSSGGPLFNMAGEVVGITSMIFEGGENLNFAIPVNDVRFLLQKRTAKLRNLPNDSEIETSKTNAETQGREQACNEQGTKFDHYNRPKRADITEFVSHFNLGSRQCFVEIGSYRTVKQEEFAEMTPSGLGNVLKDVSPYSIWDITVYDASSEGDEVPIYGLFYYNSNNKSSNCRIFPTGHIYNGSGSDPGGIGCRSKEEFDDLALKHFGISPLTRIVPMIP